MVPCVAVVFPAPAPIAVDPPCASALAPGGTCALPPVPEPGAAVVGILLEFCLEDNPEGRGMVGSEKGRMDFLGGSIKSGMASDQSRAVSVVMLGI